MPRNAGVSGRSTTRFIFLSPSARTMTLCFSGVQIVLRINLILMVPGIRLSHLPVIQAAHLGNFLFVAQLLESGDGGLDHVMRVMRADRFREHVGNPNGGDDGADRPASDDTGSFRSRLEQYHAASELA